MQLCELAEQLDQASLAKGIRHTRAYGKGRRILGQPTHPLRSDAGGYEIRLVEDVDEMLVRFAFHVLFYTGAAGAERVAGVQDVEEDVGGVEHPVQFVPDAPALAFAEDGLQRDAVWGCVLFW